MSALPQHMQALNIANSTRIARCDLKRQIRAGVKSAADVLTTPPPEAMTMSVLELLQAQHRWGRTRALRLLRAAAMSETRRIGELTERQRFSLALYLSGLSDDPQGWWT